jgi:hypothetical protein
MTRLQIGLVIPYIDSSPPQCGDERIAELVVGVGMATEYGVHAVNSPPPPREGQIRITGGGRRAR